MSFIPMTLPELRTYMVKEIIMKHTKFFKTVSYLFFGFAFFILGFSCINAFTQHSASTENLLANYDIFEMIDYSDLIIEGEVLSISDPYWDSENKDIIRKTVTIAVDETFKGYPTDTVKILVTGGQIGNYIHTVSPSIDFTAGQKLILFLREYHDEEHFVVLNSTQGALYPTSTARSFDSGISYSTAENYNFKFHTITKDALRQNILSTQGE